MEESCRRLQKNLKDNLQKNLKTQLAEESEGQFKYLGENTEKFITFSAPIKNDKLHTK